MPYIQTRTNCSVDRNVADKIKERLGVAIRLLGKSEEWLMVEFVPNCNLYFKGENDMLIAYVDVKIYGRASKDSYNLMTKEISNILNEELNISMENIYVSYSEYDNWGQNGVNF